MLHLICDKYCLTRWGFGILCRRTPPEDHSHSHDMSVDARRRSPLIRILVGCEGCLNEWVAVVSEGRSITPPSPPFHSSILVLQHRPTDSLAEAKATREVVWTQRRRSRPLSQMMYMRETILGFCRRDWYPFQGAKRHPNDLMFQVERGPARSENSVTACTCNHVDAGRSRTKDKPAGVGTVRAVLGGGVM
jgi:hypothetical protein